jgi:hypothetical protein
VKAKNQKKPKKPVNHYKKIQENIKTSNSYFKNAQIKRVSDKQLFINRCFIYSLCYLNKEARELT